MFARTAWRWCGEGSRAAPTAGETGGGRQCVWEMRKRRGRFTNRPYGRRGRRWLAMARAVHEPPLRAARPAAVGDGAGGSRTAPTDGEAGGGWRWRGRFTNCPYGRRGRRWLAMARAVHEPPLRTARPAAVGDGAGGSRTAPTGGEAGGGWRWRGRFTNRPYGRRGRRRLAMASGFSLSNSHCNGLFTMYFLARSSSASSRITRS